MRKTLLLSALALAAVAGKADVVDVTPAAYNFDSGLEVPFVDTYAVDPASLPWNPSAYFCQKYPDQYKDGLIILIGPQFKNANAYGNFVEGTKIVDLGGEVGKVLCFGGTGSNAQAALKARGLEVNLPTYDNGTNPGYMIPLWHSDPQVTDAMANGVERACRVQIVLNVYENAASATATHFQPYFQSGSNGTNGDNETPNRAVFSTDFCYNWGEIESEDHRIDFETAADDDKDIYTVDEGDEFASQADENGYVWNPNRWMVYEYDHMFGNAPEEGSVESEGPVKIKMEMPELSGATVFIKSVKFLMKDENEEAIPALTRRKTWTYMNIGTGAVEALAADNNAPVEMYNLNGVRVAADTTVPGIYVRRQGNTATKVVVK